MAAKCSNSTFFFLIFLRKIYTPWVGHPSITVQGLSERWTLKCLVKNITIVDFDDG